MSKAICPLCPHHCALDEGALGLCRARRAREGQVICENYGRVTSLALDPIEKKPLARFHPDSFILSVGGYGCNLSCPFCQNADISFATAESCYWTEYTPEKLVRRACELRESEANIGIAFTYNEPLIGYEFVLDTARLAKEHDLLCVVVTNGMLCDQPLRALLPFVDAFNIDLKTFSQASYRKLGGDLECVKETIRTSAAAAHVEVTTLVVPGFNDSEDEIDALSSWLADIDPTIPYHLSRFFPCFKMSDAQPTPIADVHRLAALAREHLDFVYTGNC